LLSRRSFDELLTHARSSYDVVIIDTPGLNEGEDCALIAVRAGAAIAVARGNQTRVSGFADMVKGLSNAGVVVVGTVLNSVPAKRKGRT
jgi:Mrp family chromosome partitioning ATPase